MRDALRMFNNFLKSGNTNIREIFEKDRQNKLGFYQLSYHQFLKSIILGEHKFYSQERSNILNLFDFDTSITDSKFHLLRILKYLFERENKQTRIGRGYVAIDEIIMIAEEVSIRREVIYDSLLRLLKFNLVECDSQSNSSISNASYVKITPCGKYYLTYLSNVFIYADLIFVDTPISETSMFEQLKRLVISTELSKRLNRTELFLRYLVIAEANEFKNHPEYSSSIFANKHFGDEILGIFEEEVKPIRGKIVNNIPVNQTANVITS